MAFEHILFDLDGTLTDSYEGIAKCVQYALHYYGIEENNEEKVVVTETEDNTTVFEDVVKDNTADITDVIADVCHVVDAQIENNRNRFASFGFVDFVYKLSISCALKPAKSLSGFCNKRNIAGHGTAYLFIQSCLHSCSTGISYEDHLTVLHSNGRF